jgi:hypothetical protein
VILHLDPEAESFFKAALEKEAREIAQAQLFDGSAAVKQFGITRHALSHISPTYLPGRRKPMFSARAILHFLQSNEQKTTKRP